MEPYLYRWKYVRSETLELLQALDDTKLKFTPEGPKWQPLYFQFNCIGRTQLVYAQAASTGIMDFSFFVSPTLPTRLQYQSKEDLIAFLKESDAAWLAALEANKEKGVQWEGHTLPLPLHLTNLAEHERLHHGQLISYFTLAGYDLPKQFKANWAL